MKPLNLVKLLLLGTLLALPATAQQSGNFTIEKVVDGIAVPWGMVWLPDGGMLVTNRAGEWYRVSDGVVGMPVEGMPAFRAVGQGGLLDIHLHPDYANNGWLYISFSSPEGGGGSHTAIMRARLQNNAL